eukprot:CAMPEP_0204120772 /NCGR_PEP_ID=MMETSP0361-20130328/7835_1 /ASSEMBLY_ACC=CAM_ASM_000343 /TAXON_ID=268821 /ORGANISM="Scrippsiella Hangoei, Strain SHTV-5" /LENGTH=243 /DNA_ID=CAMNT_0051072009 /DNA_START=711 /DNA_END=1444 /DNA_ORIENTATION=-
MTGRVHSATSRDKGPSKPEPRTSSRTFVKTSGCCGNGSVGQTPLVGGLSQLESCISDETPVTPAAAPCKEKDLGLGPAQPEKNESAGPTAQPGCNGDFQRSSEVTRGILPTAHDEDDGELKATVVCPMSVPLCLHGALATGFPTGSGASSSLDASTAGSATQSGRANPPLDCPACRRFAVVARRWSRSTHKRMSKACTPTECKGHRLTDEEQLRPSCASPRHCLREMLELLASHLRCDGHAVF